MLDKSVVDNVVQKESASLNERICESEFNFKPDIRWHVEKQHIDIILTPSSKKETIEKTETKTDPDETDLPILSNNLAAHLRRVQI